MESIIFTIIGAIGLILISIGVITKKRKKQNILYIIGGLFLLSYSISLKNVIFITLQSIFTIAAIYDLIKKQISILLHKNAKPLRTHATR